MKNLIYCVQPMEFTGTPNTSTWAGYDYLQWTGDTYHPGLDYNFGAGEEDKGKPVLCIGNGFVEKCIKWDGVTKGFGNHVFVKHTLEDGSVWYSHYCHLDSITCAEGVDIDMGAEIGKCGGSGKWPSHLHIEIRKPIGKGYDFWPKPPECTKEWIAANYADPFGFIEKRRDPGVNPLAVCSKQLDEAKADIVKIKDALVIPGEYALDVMLRRCDMLIGLEQDFGKLQQKENDLNKEIVTLKSQAEVKQQEYTTLRTHIEEVLKQVDIAIDENTGVLGALQRLETQIKRPPLTGWRLWLYKTFIKDSNL